MGSARTKRKRPLADADADEGSKMQGGGRVVKPLTDHRKRSYKKKSKRRMKKRELHWKEGGELRNDIMAVKFVTTSEVAAGE